MSAGATWVIQSKRLSPTSIRYIQTQEVLAWLSLQISPGTEYLLGSLEIRHPAYDWVLIFIFYSLKECDRSLSTCTQGIQWLACYRTHPLTTSRRAAMTPSPFFRWTLTFSNSETLKGPVLPCSQGVGVIWKNLGTGVSVDAQHQEKRQIEALIEKTVCGLLCVAQGGAAVSLQEAGLLPQHSHGCRFCGGGQNASELCLQGHIHNTCFGTTSGTDSWPSLILLSLLNPKGWRQEVNPQVMVTFSRGDLLKSASGRLCCRMAKWAGGFSAEHKENQ